MGLPPVFLCESICVLAQGIKGSLKGNMEVWEAFLLGCVNNAILALGIGVNRQRRGRAGVGKRGT